MSVLQRRLLEIIESDDGKLSWYQLDRALTSRADGLDPGMVSRGLLPALHELEQAGFIATGPGLNSGQPVYSLTPSGRAHLTRATTETSSAR